MLYSFTKGAQMKRVAVAMAFALLFVASLVFVSTTLAGPATSKQRVVMRVKSEIGSGVGTFVLTPTGSGSLESDVGAIKEAISQKQVVRGGKSVIVFTITSTWTGRRGTMVLREQIDDVAGKNGNRIGTGVWSLLRARATAQYAGLSGGGRSAYVVTPRGCCVVLRYQGSVTKP